MKRLIHNVGWVVAFLIACFFLIRSCSGPDKKYWIQRAAYDADVKTQEQKVGAALAIIADKDKVIAVKDKDLVARETRIDDLESQAGSNSVRIGALTRETAVLKANAQAVIDANPAVRALVENFELRCAGYEKQIFTLVSIIDEERAARGDWIAKYNAKDVQFKEAWAAYEREHALRLTSDALRIGIEKKLYGGEFWKIVALVEPPLFATLSLIF